ncbi:MAG: hypothetical protein WD313_00380, partial [Acidimicrobiia bacterium]
MSGRHVSGPDSQSGRRLMGLLGILVSAAIVLALVALLRQDNTNDPTGQTTISVGATETTASTSDTTSSTVAETTTPTTATTAATTTTLADPLAALALNPT